MTSDLALISEAAQALATARTLPDIRRVHNLSQRAKDYARAARLGLDAQNNAAAIALEAEARAGELLQRMAEAGERATRQTAREVSTARDTVDTPPAPATLDDLGITEHESRTWQAVASVPADVRQGYVATATEREQEVTRTGRRARRPAGRRHPHPDRPGGPAPEGRMNERNGCGAGCAYGLVIGVAIVAVLLVLPYVGWAAGWWQRLLP